MPKVCMGKVNIPGFDTILFAPMGAEDERALMGASEIIFDYSKKRSAGNHRRFFAFINKTFDIQDHYENVDIWRKILEMKAGFFDLVITEKGKPLYLPKSISWDKVDEVEFKDLFNKVVNAFLADYGHGLNDIQINEIVSF